jgi:hypothetical protein
MRSSQKADERAESGASDGDSIIPTYLLHKASMGKRILDIRLVREEYPGKARLSFFRP